MDYLFSIVIPTYKRPEKLFIALESLHRQTQDNIDFEIIIINDGPVDGYEPNNFCTSPNIHYYVNEVNLGVSASRNRAAKLASGQWLVFLDDDDQMEEHYLSILSDSIKKNPHVQCFWSGVKVIKPPPKEDELKLYAHQNKTSAQILKQFLSIGLSYGVAIRRDFFLKIGMLDGEYKVGEDTELFLRAIEHNVNPYPIEAIGIIKNEEHTDRLSFDYRLYSELSIYEKIFDRHQLTLNKHKKIYSDLLFWAYKVHLLNGNLQKGYKLFDLLVSMGFPSYHIAQCYADGEELSEEYLCKEETS